MSEIINKNQIDDPTVTDPTVTEKTVSKELYDKKVQELSRLQKELKTKRTEEENALEEQRKKDEELDELRKFKNSSMLEKGLLAGGVDSKSAEAITEAILNGEMDKIAEVLVKAMETVKEAVKEEINRENLNGTQKPSGKVEESKVTKEEFNKMSLDEKTKLKLEQPDVYKELKG